MVGLDCVWHEPRAPKASIWIVGSSRGLEASVWVIWFKPRACGLGLGYSLVALVDYLVTLVGIDFG